MGLTRHHREYLAFTMAFAIAALAVSPAEAQTLGGAITNTHTSFAKIPFVFSAIAYISGLYLAVSAIYKFKGFVDTAGKPGVPVPLYDPVMRLIAGGMFFATPMTTEAVYNSFFGNGNKIDITSRTGGSVNGQGLDGMVVAFMRDVGGPMETLLTAFSYIAAIALLLLGISRLTKRIEEGPRGPAGMGTIMTFMTAGALFAFGDMMGTFSSSIFGDNTIATKATIDTNTIGMSSADADKIQTVIEGVMAFIMIVGYIAFIRGWFVLKNFADGGAQGATIAQGLTFLFGGALAINLGELVNRLQTTVGISGLTFT